MRKKPCLLLHCHSQLPVLPGQSHPGRSGRTGGWRSAPGSLLLVWRDSWRDPGRQDVPVDTEKESNTSWYHSTTHTITSKRDKDQQPSLRLLLSVTQSKEDPGQYVTNIRGDPGQYVTNTRRDPGQYVTNTRGDPGQYVTNIGGGEPGKLAASCHNSSSQSSLTPRLPLPLYNGCEQILDTAKVWDWSIVHLTTLYWQPSIREGSRRSDMVELY